MLIAYVPDAIFAVYLNSYLKKYNNIFPYGQVIQNYFHAANAMYGVLLSLIFYIRTKQARYEWYTIYRSIIFKELNDIEKPLTNSITDDDINRVSDASL